MSRVLPAILVLLSVFPAARPSLTLSAQEGPVAKKFDEFGDILSSDLLARLDAFTLALQAEPNARGFIIVYRSRRDLPGLSHSLALRMKTYLIGTRGLNKDRIVAVDGGIASALTQELWIVPPGAAPSPRSDAKIGYLQYADSAWKFFEYGYEPKDKQDPDPEYLEAYAAAVKTRPDFTACVIGYAQYNQHPGVIGDNESEVRRDVRLDPPGTARRRLNLETRNLMKVYGLPASKIKVIDGGYRKRRAVELWIVPAGEPLPVPTPNSFPRGRSRRR